MKRQLKTFGTKKYVEWIPEKWNGHVLLFLHGLGEVGTDIAKVEKVGLPKLLMNGYETDCIVIYSQLPAGATSWGKTPLTAMVNIMKTYQAKAFHVTGLSLGGMGTISVMKYFPGFFKTAGIICGKGSTTNAEALVPTQIKAWHGTKDTTLPISNIRALIKRLNELGNPAPLVEYNAGHSIWDNAYNPTNLNGYWIWLNRRIDGDATVTQEVVDGVVKITTESGKTYSSKLVL